MKRGGRCGLASVTLLAVALVVGLAGDARAQTPTVVEYYHLDALGSVRAVTNQAGQVIRRHDYLPFGEEWTPPPSTATLRFTGKERDLQTGQDYFGARYYRADLGRFTTVDPLMTIEENLVEPQRWNRYAYVTNNPLRYVDPDGRDRMGMYQPGQRGEAAPWRGLWQEVKSIGAVAAGFVAPLFAPELATAAAGCFLSPACQQNALELMGPPGTPATPRQAAFATDQLLVQHFEKHGAEFGVATAKQYLSMASQFVESAITGQKGVSTVVRTNGDTLFVSGKRGASGAGRSTAIRWRACPWPSPPSHRYRFRATGPNPQTTRSPATEPAV